MKIAITTSSFARYSDEPLKLLEQAGVEYVMNDKGRALTEEEAIQKIRKNDRRRSDNYRYYTHRIWGLSSNYDLTIDTSMGEEAVQDIICNAMTHITGTTLQTASR